MTTKKSESLELDMYETKDYRIEITYSTEANRDIYFAVNKNTNVCEIPFSIYSDAINVLDSLQKSLDEMKGDLEQPSVKSKGVTKIFNLKH